MGPGESHHIKVGGPLEDRSWTNQSSDRPSGMFILYGQALEGRFDRFILNGNRA